jgi:uncharacterized protein YqgC (DUF456 family)
MTIALSILAALLVFLGLLGIVVPALPDLPLMLAGLFLRSVATGFQHPAINELIVASVAVGAVALVDAFAAPAVAKFFGASKRGQLGALVGSLLSFLLIPVSPWFVLILPILGTVVGELSVGKTQREALKSSLGTALGIGIIVLLKALIAFFLIGTLIVSFTRA